MAGGVSIFFSCYSSTFESGGERELTLSSSQVWRGQGAHGRLCERHLGVRLLDLPCIAYETMHTLVYHDSNETSL